MREIEDGGQFACALNREVVRWKTNIFKVPSGKAGKIFVRELARMFNAYAESSALESVRSKAKEHATHLERRLKLWAEGRMDDLIHEGRTIQKQLTRNQRSQLRNDNQKLDFLPSL